MSVGSQYRNPQNVIQIRPETDRDHDSVHDLIFEAFKASDLGYHGEAELVRRLRVACPERLAWVATENEQVVGHILFTPIEISSDQSTVRGWGLGPMAVTPNRQATGIGTQLIQRGLEALRTRKSPFVVVIGHPTYYQRMGFTAALEYDLRHGFAGVPQDVFLINILEPNSLQSVRKGKARFHDEFGPQWESPDPPE